MGGLRMRQSNLVGPAGYISLEDGAATGFVQRGVQGAAVRASVVEMGGRGVESSESRVTETSVRGLWQQYRRHIGLCADGRRAAAQGGEPPRDLRPRTRTTP